MKNRIFALLLIVAMLLIPATTFAAPEEMFDVKFSGEISAVAENGSLTVAGYTVTVNDDTKWQYFNVEKAEAGQWADVTAKRVSETEFLALKVFVRPPELRLVGPLAIAEDESWTVAGIPVAVTDETLMSERGLEIKDGAWVEVHAVYVGDPAVLTAIRVRGVEERDEVELYGVIESFSDTEWVISGITILPTADTKVMGTPKEGLLAQASLTLNEDGDLTAKRVAVAWLEPKRGQSPAQFRGEVEDVPESGLVGEWTVGGKTVVVTEETKIMQFKGLVEVGATVHVIGETNEAGDVDAFVIVVVKSPNATKPFVAAGKIMSLPEGGLLGQWKVGQKTFTVDTNTKIEGGDQAKVGALAFVQGVEKSDGTLLATLVMVKSAKFAAPAPQQ